MKKFICVFLIIVILAVVFVIKKGDRMEIIDNNYIKDLSSSKAIEIHNLRESVEDKMIIESEQIEDIISSISTSYKENKPVFSDGANYILKFYNDEKKEIMHIYLWKDGHIGFSSNKEFIIREDNTKKVFEIIN